MSQTFIRFLNLKQTLQIDPVELDQTALKLLEMCALRNYSGQRLTVTHAMQLTHVASPATIHRKLNQLIEHGYLTLEHEGQDRRTKYLTPTAKCHDYFAKLGTILQQSLT